MSPYIEAGYAVVLATLGVYAASLASRERSARRRLGTKASPPAARPAQLERQLLDGAGDGAPGADDLEAGA